MTQNISIVDRVVERLKKQPIGDLITEEDLHDIVKTAIPKTFFEERLAYNSYGSVSDRKEPVIYEIMREVLRALVQKEIENWVITNSQEIMTRWKEVTDKGLVEYVRKVEEEKATAAVKSMLMTYVQKVNEERYKMGLNPIYI